MPHSLRVKIKGLRYKGILEDKDYKRLCKALDNEDVLEQIRTELVEDYESYSASEINFDFACGIKRAIDTIDYHINHKAERR